MSFNTCKNENDIDNNIQTAGGLEAIKTKKQIQINERKKLCDAQLNKLLKSLSENDNKYLASTKNKLTEWKNNKREREIVEMINKLIDYLNCQLSSLDKKNTIHKSYIERIKISKKRLISELKKIKI